MWDAFYRVPPALLCARAEHAWDDVVVFARIWNAVLTVLVVIAALLAIAFAGVRIAGLTPYAVLTGSMEPELPVGSLVYVRDVDPNDVKPGDAITFELESGTLVTHEVFEVDEHAQTFRTHGIANVDGDGNISPDAAPVAWSQLVGVVAFCIPYLGYINNFVTHAPGIYITVSLVAVVIAVSILIELFESNKEEKTSYRRGHHAAPPKHMR